MSEQNAESVRKDSITEFPDEAAWYCDHCGMYFPAVSEEDQCPCGAKINAWVGVAEMPDKHPWQDDGAGGCRVCTQNDSSESSSIATKDCSECGAEVGMPHGRYCAYNTAQSERSEDNG